MGFFGDLIRRVNGMLFPGRDEQAAESTGTGDEAQRPARKRPTALDIAGPGFAGGDLHQRKKGMKPAERPDDEGAEPPR